MGIVSSVGVGIRDVRSCGLGFAGAGVRARFGQLPEVPVRLPSGDIIFARARSSDFSVLRQAFVHGDYCLHTSVQQRVGDRYAEIVAAGSVPVIVDAGANIGAASIWFKTAYPEAAVVAIEPESANAAMCRKNVASKSNMWVLEAAVGGAPGFVSVIEADEAWAVQTERSRQGLRIVTVGDAVSEVANGTLFIVKIDIEGFESDLFAANTDWIDDAYVVYIEPHDWMIPGGKTSRGFQREFGHRDFDMLLSGENVVYIRI